MLVLKRSALFRALGVLGLVLASPVVAQAPGDGLPPPEPAPAPVSASVSASVSAQPCALLALHRRASAEPLLPPGGWAPRRMSAQACVADAGSAGQVPGLSPSAERLPSDTR